MRDLHSRCSIHQMVGAAVLDDDPTPVVAEMSGFESAEIAIDVGIGGITFTTTNKVEFVAEHSDDGTTYDKVTDADMLGVSGISDGIIKALTAAHAAAAVYRYGYRGARRYLKVTPVFGGTHSAGTPMAILVVKGDPHTSQA